MTPTATSVATPTRWWAILTAVLAGGFLDIAVTSPLPSIRRPALAGALLVLAALWLATRYRLAALTALAAGAVLPAATGWWSLAIPATGLLILVCGTLAVRRTPMGSGVLESGPRALGPITAQTRE